MLKDKWNDAKCPEGEKFMSPENEDENKFIYDTFVKPSRRSFWMNARPCGEKLCAQDYSPMIYHNFGGGPWPTSGCFTMRYGNNGVWTRKHCELNEFFICKYSEYTVFEDIFSVSRHGLSTVFTYKRQNIL